jgi:hypothetical protein
LLISVAKSVAIGLSLGTGIVGGHFWGPLFVGCSASHLLTDLVNMFADNFGGYGRRLAEYPCVVILCTMGSAHVVTYRAHMAIMLILTLTISAFDPENGAVNRDFSAAGDYSAVFPLLVVSVFVSLMASRQFVFYKTQRSRGDITAVPEVLCEPGMEGRPMVVDYEDSKDEDLSSSPDDIDLSDDSDSAEDTDRAPPTALNVRTVNESITQNDIEMAFEQTNSPKVGAPRVPPPPVDIFASKSSELSSSRLDELLGARSSEDEDLPRSKPPKKHRRTQSAPVIPREGPPPRRADSGGTATKQPAANHERTNSRGNLVRITSFGAISEHQPSLMDQARMRAASSSEDSRHRRVATSSGLPARASGHRRVASTSVVPSRRRNAAPRHSRGSSASNLVVPISPSTPPPPSTSTAPMGGALSLDDIEQSFNNVSNDAFLQAMRSSFG